MASYAKYMRARLAPLTASRIVPYCGITFLLALTAHNQASDVALIAYVLAVFSVVSVMASMSLGAVGNLVAECADDAQQNINLFRGGFGFSLFMAAGVMLIGGILAFSVSWLPGAQMDINKIRHLAFIYIMAIPLLVMNTFLHFFHEANGEAGMCSLIRTSTTLCSVAYLWVAYVTSDTDNFIYWAMVYFVFGESLLLLCMLVLSWRRKFDFVPVYCQRTVLNVTSMGLPIALGLAGQKLYFYLLNERLAALTPLWVAQLSVYMSVVGLLMIPIVAYCQAHSLYVSGHSDGRWQSYIKGQSGLLGLIGVMLGALILSGGGGRLFFWLGGNIVLFDRDAFISTAVLLSSSAILSLSTSHLRGLRDTLAAQLIMNTLMLSVLVPIIYFVRLDSADIHFYLRLQSAGFLGGFVFLQLRIRFMHQKAALTSATC